MTSRRLLVVVIVAVASALLDNVTTVLLIAPVTFEVCRRLGLPVAPYLIAEVLASNIGGAATLVGDPPNIIIASRAGLAFNDFLVHLAPLVVVLMVVFCLACRLLFRRAFRYDAARAAAMMRLDERQAITDARVLAHGLAVLGLVMAAFVLHPVLHYEPSVVALLGAGLVVAVTRVTAGQALREVEWPYAGVLRRAVRHGRRARADGRDRRGLRGCRARRRGAHRAGRDAAAVGLGRAVGDRGQHPVRSHHEPGRRRSSSAGGLGRERAVVTMGWDARLRRR